MMKIDASNARKQLLEILSRVSRGGAPLLITSQVGDCVLVSASDWSSIEETGYICGMPSVASSIIESMNAPREEFTNMDEIDFDAL